MVVIKKSITVHPLVDNLVRKIWALLIRKGYDVNYSTTLSMLALGGCLSAIFMKEGSKEWQEYFKIINDFLWGKIEIESAKISESIDNYEKYIAPKVRETEDEKKKEVD